MKAKLALISLVIVLLVSFVSAACAGPQESIKIGVLTALTGPMATSESQAVKAIELAFNETDYQVAGRQIELIVEDYANDPALCLTKVQKLVEVDNVDVIIGPYLTSAGLAIRDYIHENRILWISHICSSPTFIEEPFYTPYFFRSSYNSGHQGTAVGAYIAYAVKGYRSAVCMAMDYKAGRDEVAGFKEVFEGLGGTVIQEIYTPIETQDYGPYMAMIDVDNADFVWSWHYAGDAIRLVKALDEYGIKDQLPLFFSEATCASPWLAQMGDSALGIESVSHYTEALNTTENRQFVQALWDNYQVKATLPSEHAYVAARMAILAIEAVNGDVEDVEGMITFLKDLEFVAPRGPIKFESHSPVQNVYHLVVERVNGELQNTVLETYPEIRPYWLPEELR